MQAVDAQPFGFPTKTPRAPILALRRRPLGEGHAPMGRLPTGETLGDEFGSTPRASAPVPATTPAVAGELEQEREQVWRLRENLLADRERLLAETEVKLAERERDLAEGEALLQARERLWQAATQRPRESPGVSRAEQQALEALKAELERQEVALKEAKQQLRERELFLEESEVRLLEKAQAEQELQTELEQRAEELASRERELLERRPATERPVGATPPAVRTPAAGFDEFNE